MLNCLFYLFLVIYSSFIGAEPAMLTDLSKVYIKKIPGYHSINWDEVGQKCTPFNGGLEVAPYVNYLKEALHLEVAFETGTWQGETTKCLSFLFDTVHTVELMPDVFEKTKNTLKTYLNVMVQYGNSPDVLRHILPSLKHQRVFFYLDAHWNSDWPLLAELETIGQTHYDNCVIMIDDIKVPGRGDIQYDHYNGHDCSYNYIQPVLSRVFSHHSYFYIIPKDSQTRAKLVILPKQWISALEQPPPKEPPSQHLDDLSYKSNQSMPGWAKAQIEEDLAFFKHQTISLKQLNDFYEAHAASLQLIKFTIRNNAVSREWKTKEAENRRTAFEEALSRLSGELALPDTVFLLSLHDGVECSENLPVFGMSKLIQNRKTILIPDFEALRGKFQVLQGKNLLDYEHPWKDKIYNTLIWRGSTAQGVATPSTIDRNSRITLCKLSLQYPSLINAKFTSFTQGAEHISSLQDFKGNWVSFEEQFQHKYHIFIDGNAAAYTKSCWKWFSNSLVFKPNSQWIQWYYKGLHPWEHFIPTQENLQDLVEKIQWAQSYDRDAETIAKNARSFAVKNLSVSDNLLYLYHALWEYNTLKFVD